MILQKLLENVPIILGSQSPRRKELLKSLDLEFDIQVKETDESFDDNENPIHIVEYIASQKLKAFNDIAYWDKLVICADTIVVDQQGKVLGKPKDLKEAKGVISQLANKEHLVYTAVAFSFQGKVASFVEGTKVWFSNLNDEEIAYYVDNYKPLDKAGSYGIQEWIGRVAIEKIEGSYENVIGLPTARLYQELKGFLSKK